MQRRDHISLKQRPGGRWLALLLALLLAMVTLSSHATTATVPADCAIATEWAADDRQAGEHAHDAAHCATCVAPIPQSLLPMAGKVSLATGPAPAPLIHEPLTPRRPPRA